MLPSKALAVQFRPAVRQRGEEYITGGVEIAGGSPTEAAAVVQGTDAYAVTITRVDERDDVRFDVSCTCPYFLDRFEACKHLWATLCVAERQGHLLGDGSTVLTRNNSYLAFVEPLDEVEDADDVTPPVARTPVRGRTAYQPPPPPAPSALFLTSVERRLMTSVTPPAPPFQAPDGPLLYTIDQQLSAGQRNVVLSVMYRGRTKTGPGKPKVLSLSADDLALLPEAERRTLVLLIGAERHGTYSGWMSPYGHTHRQLATFSLPPALALELLPVMARDGRVWLKPWPAPSDLIHLTWDGSAPWRFRMRGTETDSGFVLMGELSRDETHVLVSPGARFLIVAGHLIAINGTLARFDASTRTAFLDELGATGPIKIPKAEGPTLAHLLARSGAAQEALPEALRTTTVRVAPVPLLSIQRTSSPALLHATLSFDYDGTIVEPREAQPALFDRSRLRMVHRDLGAEAAAASRLASFNLRTAWGYDLTSMPFEVPIRSLANIVRDLLADGWRVNAEGMPYRAPASVRLSVNSGIDWFDVTAQVTFANDDTVALTEILSAMRSGARTIALGDGSVGLLPEDWLERYGAIGATGTVDGDRIRFTRTQSALLDALLATRAEQTVIEVDATFERVRRELASFTRLEPADPPASFHGTLRPYQREGLGWFAFLQRFGFGGCLADDMGLGKTIMVLALFDARRSASDNAGRKRRPSLVVVPRSLVGNWLEEAAKFTPDLRVLDGSQTRRATDAETFRAHDVVLVTYGTLRRDITALAAIAFDYVVLDEAQAVKNAATAGAKAVRLLDARHRLALSGTPIENHLGELWSLFEFLNPGVLGRSSVFQRALSKPDDETAAVISRGLRPFILRRTKTQVARDLPARTEQTIACELGKRERATYDALRQHYRSVLLDRVERHGLAKSKMHVLEALLRLRQAACHIRLVDEKRTGERSAKFDVLLPRLYEVKAEGHKALVFSQFTSLLELLREELDAAGVAYEYLDGSTRDRAARVERFQTAPDVPLFLISLKAGGVGLNLTAADYVFLLDPWWNPAVEAQAIDRAHRIGRTREVFAYRLIAKDTVEEKVLALQQSKRELADAVLTADAVGLRHLGREDLELLLS